VSSGLCVRLVIIEPDGGVESRARVKSGRLEQPSRIGTRDGLRRRDGSRNRAKKA